MLGEKIRQLRVSQGLTQKDLAEKLFVTAQAVSRWEKNEVEPSVDTLVEMSKIFKVSVSEIIGEKIPEPAYRPAPDPFAREAVYRDAKPVLALCEQCNRPIFETGDIVRTPYGRGYTRVICKECNQRNEEIKLREATEYGIKQRTKSFIWGGIIGGVLLALFLSVALSPPINPSAILPGFLIALFAYCFISCLFLKNNFIPIMVLTIASWGFVKFPGLIFSLDLDGIIWFLTVKLAFWVLGFLIAAIFLIIGCIIGIALSVFVYPFAIKKSFTNPELAES